MRGRDARAPSFVSPSSIDSSTEGSSSEAESFYGTDESALRTRTTALGAILLGMSLVIFVWQQPGLLGESVDRALKGLPTRRGDAQPEDPENFFQPAVPLVLPEGLRQHAVKLDRLERMGRAPNGVKVAELFKKSLRLSRTNALYAHIAERGPEMQGEIDRFKNSTEYLDAIYGGPGGEPGAEYELRGLPEKPGPGTFKFTYGYARCGINLDQNLVAIAYAGLSIDGAKRSCDQANISGESEWDEIVCAADVSNILANFGWLASFLSLSPSWCGLRDFAHASCAADWSYVPSAGLTVLTDSLGAVDDCQPGANGSDIQPVVERRLRGGTPSEQQDQRQTVGDGPAASRSKLQEIRARRIESMRERRLQSGPVVPGRNRGSELAQCILKINELSTMSTKFGFHTWAVSRDCGSITNGIARLLCASGVVNLISYWPYIASAVSVVVGACPVEPIPSAFCAADALEITGVIVETGAWAQSLANDCNWDGA
mmetsp:Transcript_87939/g.247061  ORF Transcript_87939/g.247061 Transcript_87939/m.247061 type:complete len:487 (+) Transcript_87939:55-1515(+)